ncbi:MAG: hypothetical protein ACOYJF_11605, partial [Prevotella sp.]
MKSSYRIFIMAGVLLSTALCATAQEDRTTSARLPQGGVPAGTLTEAGDSTTDETMAGDAATGMESWEGGLYDLSPLAYGGMGGWMPYGLHEGLNVSMDLSVTGSFGKHARSGAGFGQRLAATYVKPFGKHWWLTAGGYIDHVFWGGDSYTSGGLYGELGYQFDSHWAAYAYGQKNLVNTNNGIGYRYGRFGLYSAGSPSDYYNMSDKLGAGIRWTPNHNISVEVSVEKDWYPHSSFGTYSHQYDYPLP